MDNFIAEHVAGNKLRAFATVPQNSTSHCLTARYSVVCLLWGHIVPEILFVECLWIMEIPGILRDFDV